jgi:hypothetical protein
MRGYDRHAVDDYVMQMSRLVAELQATRSPEAAVRRALERVGDQISGILQRAHQTAEQITAQSRVEAEDRLEQARIEAERIAAAAVERVRDLDADTDRIWLERQRIVADAEDLAAQLVALAKTAAERFPADAEAVAAGSTLPDDDEDVPPTPPADPWFAASADAEEDEEPYLEEEPAEPAEPAADQSEIERTVAFQPLAPSDGESGPPAEPGAEEPADPGSASTDDDTTKVIPPASQAANRRRPE